jgi:fatty acid desaturase
MRIWRISAKDSLLVTISVAQLLTLWALTFTWQISPLTVRIIDGFVVTGMTAYNIIVVSHLFTHVPWFVDDRLNAAMSAINSINIGQSVQAYRFTHVRNHHRYNNDRRGPDGKTWDRSSTYRNGSSGEHEALLSYAIGNALRSFFDLFKEICGVVRLWRVGSNEREVLALSSGREPQRTRELRQVQIDHAAHCVSLLLFSLVSWQWTVYCYIPAFFAALTLVNVQNYYRHFGADPDRRAANSVSHYGHVYNLLTFNDGFHQEHHLAPGAHWSMMPAVRDRWRFELDAQPRIVSPVPAMLGFLYRDRLLLHRRTGLASSR